MLPDLMPIRIGSCHAPERASRRDRGRRALRFPAGAALIKGSSLGNLLFDCGYGPRFFSATDALPERIYRWLTPVTLPHSELLPQHLAAAGIGRPDLVLLSHLHADHICGLFDLTPMPPVLTSRVAWLGLGQGGRIATLKAGCPQPLRQALLALQPRFIEDFAQVAPPLGCQELGSFYDLAGDGSLLAVPLPGHGLGQFGLFLPQTTSGAHFLIADAAWSRAALRDDVLPPNFVLNRLGDAASYRLTFERLRGVMLARRDLTLWPSHCQEAFG